jgi:hypothetical protein
VIYVSLGGFTSVLLRYFGDRETRTTSISNIFVYQCDIRVYHRKKTLRSETLVAGSVNIKIVTLVTPTDLAERYRRFGGSKIFRNGGTDHAYYEPKPYKGNSTFPRNLAAWCCIGRKEGRREGRKEGRKVGR